jgi:hypothetical protein
MKKLVLLLLVAGVAGGCGAQSANPSGASPVAASKAAPASSLAAPDDKLTRIRALVGSPTCTSDAQCHTLPLGAKSCGGPAGYIAWSSAKTQEAELRALGDSFKEQQQAANAASGMMSNCSVVPDPGAICKTGICQLGSGAAAQAR